MKRALVVLAALVACKGKEGDYSGIGHWRFGVSTLKDAASAGKCGGVKLADGRDATWCLGLQPMKIGQRSADVDLYFLGDKADAPLIEVQLKIRGCDEDEVDRFMRKLFGEPFETRQQPWREYWKNSFMWMLAQLPDAPAHCTVHFLPIEEKGEIERLSKPPEAKPPTAPPPDAATAAPPDAAARPAAKETSSDDRTALADMLVAEAGSGSEHRDMNRTGSQGTATSPSGRVTLADKQLDDGVLDPDAVSRRLVATYMTSIKRCYAAFLKKDPSARGKLLVSFTVSETGRVKNASVHGFSDEVDRCVQGWIASWRFAIPKDRANEPTTADVAFTFQLVPD